MSRFLTLGTITGVLGFLATVAGLFQFNALQVILADPQTANTIQLAIGLAMQIASTFMPGVKPTAE